MECSRDSGNCWEKDLASKPGHGILRRSLAACRAHPARPAGTRRGRPRRAPTRHPGLRSWALPRTPALLPEPGGRSTAAVPAWPGVARGVSKEREFSSRSFPSSPGLRAGGSDAESVRLFRHPGEFEPTPFASLPPPSTSGLSFPRGGAAPSQRGARGSPVVHPARRVRAETEKNTSRARKMSSQPRFISCFTELLK